jgi:hypothetical protein
MAIFRMIVPSRKKVESKKPQGIRKECGTNFGQFTAKLSIGKEREKFCVHADLLCMHSPFFRQKIQPTRKPLDDECAICQDDLGPPGAHNPTYCKTQCGTSIHLKCIYVWKIQPRRGEPTCTFCRAKWENPKSSIHIFPDLDPEGYSIYQEWLYRRHICIDDSEDGLPTFGDLVAAYIFGAQIKENTFCSAILETGLDIIVESGMWPGITSVVHAYKHITANSPLRRYLATVYVKMEDGRKRDKYAKFPPEFLKDVCRVYSDMLQTEKRGWEEEAKKEFCGEIDHASGYMEKE